MNNLYAGLKIVLIILLTESCVFPGAEVAWTISETLKPASISASRGNDENLPPIPKKAIFDFLILQLLDSKVHKNLFFGLTLQLVITNILVLVSWLHNFTFIKLFQNLCGDSTYHTIAIRK